MTGYEKRVQKAAKRIKSAFSEVKITKLKAKKSIFTKMRTREAEKYAGYIFRRIAENKKLKLCIMSAAALFVSFANGCIPIFKDIYPLSLSLLCASGQFSFFIFLGSCLSCVTYPKFSLVYFLSNILLYTVKLIAVEKKLKNTKLSKSITALICGMTVGIVRFAAQGFSSQAISFFALFSASLGGFTYVFSHIFEKTPEKESKIRFVSLCISACLSAFCSVKVASFFNAGLYNFGIILSESLILTLSHFGGVAYGALCALVCAVALGMPEMSVYFFASGIFAGLAFRKKPVSKALIHLLCSFFVFLNNPDISAFYTQIPNTFISALLFLCASVFVSQKIPPEHKEKQVNMQNKHKNFLELSKVFSSLSDMFFKISDKQKAPERERIDLVINSAFSQNCKSCSLCSHCFAKESVDKKELSEAIYNCLTCGNLSKSALPEKLYKKCIKIDDIIDKINLEYSKLMENYFRNNKTEILAQQYSSVARIIKYTEEKNSLEEGRDSELERKTVGLLRQMGIKYDDVIVTLSRPQKITITNITPEEFPLGACEISNLISEKCGLLFSEPEFCFENGSCDMKFIQRPLLSVEYSQASCSKNEDEVNGDCINFFKNDEEFFYSLISDGMGSGRTAALSSKLTSVFIEKFLTTGAQKSVTLELLNNLLLSKNDECFATVDLLEIDLLFKKASFIKAGAAPAYIVRTTKLYKIASATPPAGIIQGFCAENTSFQLEKGDVVVMLSDGIVQSFDETPWLCEILTFDTQDDPCTLAEKILAKAKYINARRDDMSVVVLKIV